MEHSDNKLQKKKKNPKEHIHEEFFKNALFEIFHMCIMNFTSTYTTINLKEIPGLIFHFLVILGAIFLT